MSGPLFSRLVGLDEIGSKRLLAGEKVELTYPIKMENEGVIATSGEPYHPITRSYSGSTSTHSYNSASSSDLEDLINDILTVEN